MCLALISTVIGVAGAIAQGQAAAASAEAQARAYEQQAQGEQQAAAFEAMQEHRKQELQMSAARAQVGASGVGFQGSPTAVLTANAGQGQLDLEAIRYGSQLRQNTLTTQAEISRMEGKQARTASFINAAGTAVRGFGSMYNPTTRSVNLGANPFR